VNARVGHQVCLELRDIHVQGSVETKRGRERRNDLGNQAIQVCVGRALNAQVPLANVVEGLVVQAKGTIRVLQEGMRGKDRVVGFHNRRRYLGRWGDGKGEL
jgi:hypothetical protein